MQFHSLSSAYNLFDRQIKDSIQSKMSLFTIKANEERMEVSTIDSFPFNWQILLMTLIMSGA